MKDHMWNLYQTHFPLLAEKTIKSKDIGNGMLLVELDDGRKYSFDMYDKYLRDIPQDPNDMTEEECRRELGFRLEKIMRLKGITQCDLSEMTGIGQVSISNYITGKTSPGFYNLDKIAKTLGCSIDEFRYL